jgi:ribosome biogenesis GTPase A
MSSEKKVKIGIIGFTNVGKSTLINDFISSSNENEDIKAGGN